MKTRILLFFFALLLGGAAASAFESGRVYRITNNYNHRAMAISTGGSDLMASASNTSDRRQWWYFIADETDTSGRRFYLRNVASGAYMRYYQSNWSVVNAETPEAASMLIEFVPSRELSASYADNLNVIHLPGNSQYAHNNITDNVIPYIWNAEGSQWIVDNVALSDAELAQITDRMNGVSDELAKTDRYRAYLENLFEDASCTKLREGVDLALSPDYAGLPPALKKMADKVSTGVWDEGDGDLAWDSDHAWKYRVQLYEPYSEGNAAAGLAAIQAYTNMNNPTGILSNTDEVLYIMVEDDVPEGATLYIGGAPDEGMYNSTTSGTKLHKGLNAMLCYDDHTVFYIYYTVNTVKDGKPSQYKVTDFAPIKIHIEGGRLNGFFNYVGDKLYTADTWDDFKYTSARASHVMYDLLGKYVILHFHLEDTPAHPGETPSFGVKSSLDEQKNPRKHKYNPVEIMHDWDNMCLSERILMGIQSREDIGLEFNRGMYDDIVGDAFAKGIYKADPGFYYSDYFNNRMMGISQRGDLYMNATSWRTAYNVNTISYVLTEFYDDGLWGPAHEYGHMNQGPINMAGTTEESNNTFSNVATYFSAEYHGSRNDWPVEQLKAYKEGKNFIQYGGANTTRMFWQLWCYYHGTRHNTKFYPRLYELLRKNPLKKVTAGNGVHNERYDLLHFAKMCCVAAEEDLTNFFTAWGFFVPLDHFLIDDYSRYDAVLTPEDIEAVKAEIKEFGFEENNAILFIDDRVGMDSRAGDFGSFDDFSGEGSAPSGDFSFTVDGTNVKVSGGSGAGYLVFDEDGNLLGFSNSNSFDLTPEAAQALLDGKASVKAVGSDNTEAPVTNTVLDGSIDDKIAMLRDILANVDAMLEYTDGDDMKVGYFKEDYCETLSGLRDEAEGLLDSQDSGRLTDIIKQLSAEYLSVLNNSEARVVIVPGATYRFTNRLYPAKVLAGGASTCVSAVYDDSQLNVFSQQWIFEETDRDGYYAIRNLDSGLYVGTIGYNDTPLPLTDTPVAHKIVGFDDLTGLFAFAPEGNNGSAIHMASNGNIVKWTATSTASNWTLTKVNDEDYVKLHDDLKELLDDAAELLAKAGTITYPDPEEMTFTEDCFYSNAPYTASDNGDKLKTWTVLTDGNVDTYFHSDYSGKNSADGLDHYIRMRAPGESTFRNMTLHYTTRNSESAQATKISGFRIDACADTLEWKTVYSVSSGLNTGAAQVNTTPEIRVPKGTKYVRFMVTNAPGRSGGHPFFAVSQLGVLNRGDEMICTPASKYKKVLPADMEAVAMALADTREEHSALQTSQQDLENQYDKLSTSYANLLAKMNTPTSADEIEADCHDDDDAYYNLQGIKTEHPQPGGIYIHNRKKILK